MKGSPVVPESPWRNKPTRSVALSKVLDRVGFCLRRSALIATHV
jgi:hypothetical protein